MTINSVNGTGFNVAVTVAANQPAGGVIFTTADNGPGSLREALYYKREWPQTPLLFNIPTSDPGYSGGAFTIRLNSPLPDHGTVGSVLDGATQTAFTGNTNPLGPEVFIDGATAGDFTHGARITAANCTLKNLGLVNFEASGIWVEQATGARVTGCFVGVGPNGATAMPNGWDGIALNSNTTGAVIGGNTAADRNIISGNTSAGIRIQNGSTGNAVKGNFIGSTRNGLTAVPNLAAVAIDGLSNNNTIGGSSPFDANLLSGNSQEGIWINNSSGTLLRNNAIGVNINKNVALPNQTWGIAVRSGSANTVIYGNVISGNGTVGIGVGEAGSDNTIIQANMIGVSNTGAADVGNGTEGVYLFGGCERATIGGTTSTVRNVISGNGGVGIAAVDSHKNKIFGNYIGPNAAGNTAIGNLVGVSILNNSKLNQIGGSSPGFGNVISGNPGLGLNISGLGTDGNVVQGNLIGLGSDGLTALPNTRGIRIFQGAKSNLIGGTSAGARNYICGSTINHGITILDTGTESNNVQGNFIGLNRNGSQVGNEGAGVALIQGCARNVIGGNTAAHRNIISGNDDYGVLILDPNTSRNLVQGNYIGTSADGSSAVANGRGVWIGSRASLNTIGGSSSGQGNVISGNTSSGVYLSGSNLEPLYNSIQGNLIGTTASGDSALPNGRHGIEVLSGTAGTLIGGGVPTAGNVIAHNSLAGVHIPLNATGISIRLNKIFANAELGIELDWHNESLGVTPNDVGDVDEGPNGLQNFPTFSSISSSASTATLSMALNSHPSENFAVDVFGIMEPDASNHGEGDVYLGSKIVTTNASGNVNFAINIALTPGLKGVTATATRMATGDTSEFSQVFGLSSLTGLSVNPSTVIGGATATGTVTLAAPALQTTVVQLQAQGTNISVPPSVTVPVGQSSASFNVTTTPTASTVSRVVSAYHGGVVRSFTVQITAAVLLSFIVNPSTVQGGQNTEGTVTLSGPAPAGGAVVNLSSASTVIVVPSSVTVSAGQTSANFVIATKPVGSTVVRTASATYNGITKSVAITLTP